MHISTAALDPNRPRIEIARALRRRGPTYFRRRTPDP